MDYPKTIYAIQHNVTKKIYVGSSNDVENRYLSHVYALRNQKHSVEDLQEDFNVYGEDFSLFLLDEIRDFEERHKEFAYMKKYNSHIRGQGYNYKDNYARKRPKPCVPYKKGTPHDLETECECTGSIKQDYIEKISMLVKQTNDVALLDLISRLLEKESVKVCEEQ